MNNDAGAMNLSPNRGPNIWDDERWNAACGPSATGRWLLGIGGTALLTLGATRGSAARRMMSIVGAVAALSVASGRVSLDRPLAWAGRLWTDADEGDRVDDDSKLSFPASDAPAWTATTGTGTPER